MANISADFVIKLALILVLSVLPSLVYLLIFQKAKKRWQARLRRAQNLNAYHYSYRDQRNRDFHIYSNDSYPLQDRRSQSGHRICQARDVPQARINYLPLHLLRSEHEGENRTG